MKRGTPVVLAFNNHTGSCSPCTCTATPSACSTPARRRLGALFLDTVQVPEKPNRADRLRGRQSRQWLLASTVLERFDAGLWTWIEVT